MQGCALLMLWNDIAPSVEAEYNHWHSSEHVPERVTVPGIRVGRRYVREDDSNTDQRYLSIYELESTAVLSSAPYLALMNQPTPWSQKMRPHFRNIRRIACMRETSASLGIGGCTRVFQFDTLDEIPNTPQALVDRCLDAPGIIAAHWCVIDPSVPGLSWNSPGETARNCAAMLMVEATDAGALHHFSNTPEFLSRLAARATPGAIYRARHIVEKNDAR